MSKPADLVQGTLDMLVLKILALQPLNGWAISQRLKQISSDVLGVSDGSLYPALHKLEHRGWIRSQWKSSENNRRAKLYSLTPLGRKQLEKETANWNRVSAAISGIVRLEDLRGKIIAFEDPGSTSGYFLPKLFLLKKGFSVVEKPSAGAKVSDREIGYIFADTYQNIASLVLQNKVAAGAFSSDDYASVDVSSKASISILGESESVPRHLVSVRKDLPEPVAKRLKEILLGMHQNDEGKTILRQTDGTTQFDLLPGGEESGRRKLVELYRPRRGK